MFRRILIWQFSVFFICACGASSNEDLVFDKNYSFRESGQINFALDSISIAKSDHFSIIKNEDQVFLSFFNQPDNSILLYDFDTKQLVQRVRLQTEGPNALISINSAPSNFYIKNLDSIFIYSAVQSQLFLISSDATVKNKWGIESIRDDPKYPAYVINTLNPIQFQDGKIIIVGSLSWYEDGVPPILTLDLKNEIKLNLPENLPLYTQWDRLRVGSSYFFQPSNTRINYGDVLVSYPKDHRIIKYSDSEIEIIDLANPKIADMSIYSEEINQKTYMSQDYIDYSMITAKYHAILSDDENRFVFRFARLPSSMDLLSKVRETGEKRNWDYSVMIYDHDFSALGEFTFENRFDLDFNSMFVQDGKLFILKNQEDENLLSFAMFELYEVI
ncbi:DUF4221 family protein [Roseivirga sp. UBA1976]|uniref:DUF4221 family protein n=1 Tax=Roseivirga sp. UBA1976 TaxID=1947386 RepID=UPI00257B63C4|nr:DUF4221 family protein [Roseivirga sp. UBA1976]|tara:strand:- start:2596 stop:3759 length:1164 start_codon:yes stop_codon:yes gene_type:complete